MGIELLTDATSEIGVPFGMLLARLWAVCLSTFVLELVKLPKTLTLSSGGKIFSWFC